MMKLKFPTVLASLILAMGLLSSCAGKGTENPPDPFVPADPIPVESETEDATDYALLSALPFAELAQADGADFEIAESNGEITVTAYKGNATKVRIPERIGDKPVTGLADGAFSGQSALTVLYIPDSVVDFGKNILVGCSQLYALRSPLPTKEGTAFLGYLYGAEIYEKNNMPDLRNLDFLEIGGTLTSLGAYALYDCNDLVTVRLPDTVKTLESYSLYRCEALKYINAEGLTEIEPFAMAHCSSLTDLKLGSGLSEIGLGALEGCDALRNLTLPFVGGSQNENTYLGYIFGATDPAFSADLYPHALRRVTLLSGCTQIGDYAFYRCQSLHELVLSDGIVSVGLRAFSECVRLGGVKLPDGLRQIREYAFEGCISMKTLSLGSSLQTLGVGAFSDCSALTELALPQTLKVLPSSAFSGCARLERIHLGGVETVGANAFYHCSSLSEVIADQKPTLANGNEALKSLLDA